MMNDFQKDLAVFENLLRLLQMNQAFPLSAFPNRYLKRKKNPETYSSQSAQLLYKMFAYYFAHTVL